MPHSTFRQMLHVLESIDSSLPSSVLKALKCDDHTCEMFLKKFPTAFLQTKALDVLRNFLQKARPEAIVRSPSALITLVSF